MFRQNNYAFTLIELLVVVLIIGILTAVALPQYQKAVIKSRYATLKNLVKSIANAEEAYFLANGKYSYNFEELDIMPPDGKLSSSNNHSYIYDWGECTLLTAGNYCHNRKFGIRYGIYFQHANEYAGMQRCSVTNDVDSSAAHNICKQDSGLLNPTYISSESGTAHYFW